MLGDVLGGGRQAKRPQPVQEWPWPWYLCSGWLWGSWLGCQLHQQHCKGRICSLMIQKSQILFLLCFLQQLFQLPFTSLSRITLSALHRLSAARHI